MTNVGRKGSFTGKGRRESGWLTRRQMAAVFDVSPWSFDQHVRPLLPADAVRGEGKDLRFYAAGVVEAWAIRRFRPSAENKSGESDPLLVGPQSPALERYREARAEREELLVAQLRGDLVDRREFQALLLRTAHILRGCGEALQRQFGPDAQGILDESIDDVEREVQRHFAQYEGNGDVNGGDAPRDDVTNQKGS